MCHLHSLSQCTPRGGGHICNLLFAVLLMMSFVAAATTRTSAVYVDADAESFSVTAAVSRIHFFRFQFHFPGVMDIRDFFFIFF